MQDEYNRILVPREYSNGTTQHDVVNEVLEALDDNTLVFLKGGVGTGKSAIALHLISYYGKGIISTPTKLLEGQYVNDYCGENSKQIVTNDGEQLRVNNLRGRTNFQCINPPPYVRHKNPSCGYSGLPCTMRLEEGARRIDIAIECPYWSPIYRSNEPQQLLISRGRKPIKYTSITGKKTFYLAEAPCPYYAQFIHFTKPGAIIMNSAKWEAETWVGRKPKVPIEIIDEGDQFLDGLSYQTTISRELLQRMERGGLFDEEDLNRLLIDFEKILNKHRRGFNDYISKEDDLRSFLQFFMDLLQEAEHSESLQYLESKLGVIMSQLEYSWARVKPKGAYAGFTVFIPRLDITLNELVRRSGRLVFMSATSHTEKSMSDIFKINPKMVTAEDRFPGTLYLMRPENSDLPRVTYRMWKNKGFREFYWEYLDKLIDIVSKPCLIQVHSWRYLPPKYTPTKEDRKEDYWGYEEDIRFSTKTDRGVDLYDDLCRSIIIMKYPLPGLDDPVFMAIKKLLGNRVYWDYVKDIADRDLVQQCGRAIRHDDDWCEVYSMDSEALKRLPRLWNGDLAFKYFIV